jgi:hypothetical protein
MSRAVGEIAVSQDRVGVYASPEGLGQAFAFDILKESYHAESYIKTIKKLYGTARSTGSTTTWVLSSHDVSPIKVPMNSHTHIRSSGMLLDMGSRKPPTRPTSLSRPMI